MMPETVTISPPRKTQYRVRYGGSDPRLIELTINTHIAEGFEFDFIQDGILYFFKYEEN